MIALLLLPFALGFLGPDWIEDAYDAAQDSVLTVAGLVLLFVGVLGGLAFALTKIGFFGAVSGAITSVVGAVGGVLNDTFGAIGRLLPGIG